MKETQVAEPPSCLQSPMFMVGRDSHGNWVVQDQSGVRGGLFIDRAEALRFVRFENGNHPRDFVTVNEIFELDMSRRPSAKPNGQPAVDTQPRAQSGLTESFCYR
jgi:hypothetical protein